MAIEFGVCAGDGAYGYRDCEWLQRLRMVTEIVNAYGYRDDVSICAYGDVSRDDVRTCAYDDG